MATVMGRHFAILVLSCLAVTAHAQNSSTAINTVSTVNLNPETTANPSAETTVNLNPETTVNLSSETAVNLNPETTVNLSAETTVNLCDANPCENNTVCHLVSGLEKNKTIYLCLGADERPGTCSMNQFLSCEKVAQCIDSEDFTSFRCQCPEEAVGDGLQVEVNGTGCRFAFKTCTGDNECPEFGYCDALTYKCVCKLGFQGDGFNCTDIDECLNSPCDKHALCQNTPGNYTCTCDALKNYVGDGRNCTSFCYNDNDCDVPRAKCNEKNKCQCIQGYSGDGIECQDVDECAPGGTNKCNSKAKCINNVGGYQCECNNGYTGDGFTCENLPQKCDDILDFIPGSPYTIDPDFTGPAKAFQAICEMVSDVVVTKIPPTDIFPLAAPENDASLIINYKPSPSDLVPLTENAAFCYQEMSFSCYAKFALFPGTTWTDARGKSHENWGSTQFQQCACGEVGLCPSRCFCDGNQTQTLTTDYGMIIDKTRLPVASFTFKQGLKDKGRVNIGPLKCGQKQFDIAKNCDVIKFEQKVTTNTARHVDVDGPGGFSPFLAACFMDRYDHVGITSLPPTSYIVIASNIEVDVSYSSGIQFVQALVDNMDFCSQHVEYTCKNSKLTNGGGYVSVTAAKRRLDYFPGANGQKDSCGCGATHSCEDPNVLCQCDILDGQERKDFGLIINKADLPVVGLFAAVGSNGSGVYKIKNIECASKQFGIEPNCEKYRATGSRENHTYFIDSNGPGTGVSDPLDPFLVECRFLDNPPQGQTIVHHTKENQQTLIENIWNVIYLQATELHIEALKNRSTVCTQEIKLGCHKLSIQDNGAGITWTGAGGSLHTLIEFLSSCGDSGQDCNCGAGGGDSTDNGLISDKDKLPVNSLDISTIISQLTIGGKLTITLGPLVCSEVFPTCAILKNFFTSGKAVEGEATVVNGRFTIDPDGVGGVTAFEATCSSSTTIISIETPVGGLNSNQDKPESVSNCFDITYKNEIGQTITAAQVTALVQKSGKCRQDLTLECQYAPATNKVNYTSCDGHPQKGWAGSFGEDKCACGVNGNCDGGPKASCNCDMADGVIRSDSGSLINKTAMPVCQICFSIDPIIPPDGGSGPTSVLRYKLGELKCDTDQGTKTNCQDARQKAGTTVKTVQETPVAVNPGAELPVGCKFYPDPPIGMLLVKASEPIKPPSVGNQTDIKIVYITISIREVRQTFINNEFCSQIIFLFNASAQNLQFSDNFGFFTYDGRISKTWIYLNETSKYVQKACTDYADLCSKHGSPKGFKLTSMDDLPITRVVLAGIGVTVVIGDVECFDLKQSCQHVLDSNSMSTGFIGGTRYAIDPDQAGEIQPFTVTCSFDQTNGNGVTEILPTGQFVGEVVITGQKLPGNYSLPVEYNSVTAQQISYLTKVSQFCWQWVTFKCALTPLVSRTNSALNSYYSLYDMSATESFAAGFDVTTPGCACAKTGTCVSNQMCNCNALKTLAIDQGAITDKDHLPITRMFVGGQQDKRSTARVKVSGVRCSKFPIDPPRDCAAALKIGSQFGVSYAFSGEYLISPSPKTIKPFMVRCEFELMPNVGVTVFKVKSEDVPLAPPGMITDITYYAETLEQILTVINQSQYCYQSVRFDCRSSTLFSEGGYWFGAGSTNPRTFWGGGQPGTNGLGGTCACGQEKNCGGLDSAEGQRTRACNCDYGDNTTRADAGIISVKEYLPITGFTIGKHARFFEASLTVGDLYCSQEPLEFNECDLDLYDCDPKASCVDQSVGYRCVCPQGWNGKGVITSNSQARANGRECIDDDECKAANPCPYSAICENTPGDFKCTCKPGYKQTSKTTCQDINECSNSSLNTCDPNARCENLDGSYRCICNRGYSGDGRICLPIGSCVCFGDPHCITYDSLWLHVQDTCDYVMSQDGCHAGETQTFRVEIHTSKKGLNRPGKFAYVESVEISIFGKKILLGQGGRIVVDGSAVRQYSDGHLFGVSVVNNVTQLWTVYQLQVSWDGQDVVQIIVPKNNKDSLCGLCGNNNGNPKDDTVQGPACIFSAGEETENLELFIQSWITENSTCQANCRTSQPNSSDDQCIYPVPLVKQECGKLMSPTDSPLKDCLKMKNSSELAQFLYSCVYDGCHIENNLEDFICRFASIMAWDCQENERVNVNGWKSKFEACKETKCPNNMIFQPCGSGAQPTCLTSSQEQGTEKSSSCVEGCYCETGLVQEGNKCILPKHCGCVYSNGYLAVGDKVILPNCSAEVECIGPNVTTQHPAGCGENEVCMTREGLLGCYCIGGYIRNTKGLCEADPCYSVMCKLPNMVCMNGTCECQDGYTGDCGHCVDIDECATGIADCNWIGQTCLNTNGSYRCVCEKGYAGDGHICKDIDECEYGIDLCGANSECVNGPGSFVCECCSGFTKSSSGTCARDTSSGPVSAKCCACEGENCDDPGKVCGTDGKTYSNFRSLYIAACRANNDKLKASYPGQCKDSCDAVVCEKQYSTCTMKDGVPTCLCPTCADSASSYLDVTVCGTDNVTYISECHLQAATCKANIKVKVEVQYTGRPCPGKGPPLSGPWKDWSACSEQCKQGVKTRTRDVFVNSSDASLHSVETIPCYSTCDKGPCKPSTCTDPSQVCVADENNKTSCLCPVCDDFPEHLICGRLGYVIRTYKSECELNKTACEQEESDYEVVEPRACEEKPTKCAQIRKYEVVVDENGCEADRSINFGECYGGCDNEAQNCCFGKTDKKSAFMYCPDGFSFMRFFDVITNCSCVAKEEANSRAIRPVL